MCDMSVLCLYLLLIAVIDHLPPFSHTAATLSFLDFYKIFFLIFLFFIFPSSHIPQICRYCQFICTTIAQNTFCVQLVVRSNFNRSQRKYERFCLLQEMVVLFPCLGRKLKT